jgi:SAM-dependent methyltransferase
LAQFNDIPTQWFERVDNSPDETFYDSPRFVAHIDQATIDALTEFYREFIAADSSVLDLMSSWISHLPPELLLARAAGLGMNEAELARNDQLSDWCVHNLNQEPDLPYPPHTFDRVLIAVSVQYLIRPLEVFASIHTTLRPGGKVCIAMSHRLFPTKAIAAFQQMSPQDRMGLVGFYLEQSGFEDVETIDRSPPQADPLWLVTGTVGQ